MAVEEARTLVFIAMTAGNLGLVRVNDTRRIALLHLFEKGHAASWLIAVAACLIVTACIPNRPWLNCFNSLSRISTMPLRQRESVSGRFWSST